MDSGPSVAGAGSRLILKGIPLKMLGIPLKMKGIPPKMKGNSINNERNSIKHGGGAGEGWCWWVEIFH